MRFIFVFLILIGTSVLFAEEIDTSIEGSSRIYFLDGTVKYKKKGQNSWSDAELNHKLSAGDEIKTGENGKVTIKLANSGVIRLKELSSIIIPEVEENKPEKMSFIKLVWGVLWAHAKKAEHSLTVATPTAICGVRGTKFTVEALEDENTEVNVLDGVVAVNNSSPALSKIITMIKAGQATHIRKGKAPLKAFKARTAFIKRSFDKFETISKKRLVPNAKKLLYLVDELDKSLSEEK